MIIKSVSFQNYKSFAEKQELEIKPITILIGKNSSGKSAIAKLFTLLENSLSGLIDEPLHVSNGEVELGSDFRDLVYNRAPKDPLYFTLDFFGGKALKVGVIKENDTNPTLKIYSWSYPPYSFVQTSSGLYVDEIGTQYEIVFKGIIPSSILKMSSAGCELLELEIIPFNLDVDYIGPFRVLPERAFILTGQLNYEKTGIRGQNAYSMLGVSKLLDGNLYKQVGDWYERNFDGWRLNVSDSPYPYLEIKLSKEDSDVNIVDVGQGMNQALPLVVRAHISKPDSMIILEQPELHLHPAAHGDLAELFAKSAKENNQTFLIETHSENIILRLRRLIVEQTFGLTSDDVVIYWVTDGETKGQQIQKITIDDEGTLSDWPEGIFTENIVEITELRKALKKKKNNNDNSN